MANLTGLTNYFITAQEGFTTTLASPVSAGASTVPLNSLAGYADGDAVALVVEPASLTAKQVVVGIKSGTTLVNSVWTEGTNQAHAAGATVADYTTATHQAAHTKGILVGLNPDGTHKAFTETNIVPTAAIQDNAVTSAKIPVNGIPADRLATSSIKLARTTLTSNIGASGPTVATQITGMTASPTIPAGGRDIEIEAFFPSISGSGTINFYISIWDGAVGTGTQLQETSFTFSGGSYLTTQIVKAYVTPAAGAKTYNVGFRVTAGSVQFFFGTQYPGYITVKAV